MGSRRREVREQLGQGDTSKIQMRSVTSERRGAKKGRMVTAAFLSVSRQTPTGSAVACKPL